MEMKKKPRFDYQLPNDLHVFGLTADEPQRIAQFITNNYELELEWILADKFYTKDICYDELTKAGIKLPVMYDLGFKNNNCIGCVKATSAVYWDKTRTLFPEHFARRAKQSRNIDCRLVRYKGERMFLDELPAVINPDMSAPDEDIECGVMCEGSTQLTLIDIRRRLGGDKGVDK